VHLEDILVEEGANFAAAKVAEEALYAKGLSALDDGHVVQLKELNHQLDPLEVHRLALVLLLAQM